MIDVCLLGCGGMIPLPNRNLTSLLIRCNGKMILIDCGEGTQVPIKLSGWGFKSIEAICFTHYHADHVTGLPGLLLTIGNSGREDPLIILGPPGINEIVKGLTIVAPVLPYDLVLVELSNKFPDTYNIGEITVKSTLLDHWIECLAYSIEVNRAGRFDIQKAKDNNIPIEYWKILQKGESINYDDKLLTPDMVLGQSRKGIKISYSTDTRPVYSLIDFISNSDLFICEGIYGENEKLEKAIDKKHMIFSEAAYLAKEAAVKELWLTHYSPALEKPEEFIENARNIFSNSYNGEDLMFKTLNFDD